VLGLVDALRLGVIPAGARLAPGTGTAVRVRPTAAAPPTPPASLADAAGRIPSGGSAQVRVERYDMAGGTRQFAVYVAGTRTGGGDEEPFDAASNLALFSGETSASYEAVTAALRQAGAVDGDAVHAFGHSQGAMVLERLALEGTYDTRTLVSFGSPVQADVGQGTLAVSFRHTDDPVVSLQSGGHAVGVGAPGSFVVERLADPAAGVHDLQMPAHNLSAYVETAALVDSSGDPRAEAVRDVFERLGAAESAVATEYVAERVSPLVVGGGGR
jgi:pimeloyl-ACP methyl ester carboxylesterase